MKLMEGKKGVILGVANPKSIASGIAQLLNEQGAELAFNYLPETGEANKNERRVLRALEGIEPKLMKPCDVTKEEDVVSFFEAVKSTFGQIDFLVHSIAFAPTDVLRGRTIDANREGFLMAMDISAYSYLRVLKEAEPLFNPEGASAVAMTYLGAEKVIAGYNIMGVCKAALESITQYAAYDLGIKNVRVNAISAGPIRTLAASAVKDFSKRMDLNKYVSPLQRNMSTEDVAKATLYFLSDLSTGTTGEIHHVDGGYNIMGNPGRYLDYLESSKEQ